MPRFVSRRRGAPKRWTGGLILCLACGGRAADGDGLPSFEPDGIFAGASGGRAGNGTGGGGGRDLPPRPPREGSSGGRGGAGGEGGSLGEIAPDPAAGPLAPDESRCPQLPGGQIEVRNQVELEALRGCSSLAGDLTIYPFARPDLTALADLERVGGALTLGDPYAEPPPISFASLSGLESLRTVGSLVLRGVAAPSLAAFSGLSELTRSDGIAPVSGLVFIDHCPALEDFQGLNNLQGLSGFIAKGNARLLSLRGLRVPATLSMFEIWDSPVNDIGALAALTAVNDTLWFINTGITNVASLAQLSRVEQLQLSSNASLLDVEGLAGLTSVKYFALIGNPLLEALPELPLLSDMFSLSIAENASLREVGALPALRRLNDAGLLANPLLARAAALGALESAGELYVDDNPVLAELDLGRLAQVDGLLRVTHNPSLDAGGLRLPAAANSVIGGNRGDMLGLDPCPWTGNNHCEGPPLDDLCAAGSDSDCAAYDSP